jgi:hypothetical protein
VEDMGSRMPRIYVDLENKQVEYQSHMIEVEGIDPRVVESFQLLRNKHEKCWLVHMDTGTKRKVTELVKSCPVDMNGLSTKDKLNIIPLGSYDYLVGMDWLDQHYTILDFRNKEITFLDEEGNRKTIQGIPRAVVVR